MPSFGKILGAVIRNFWPLPSRAFCLSQVLAQLKLRTAASLKAQVSALAPLKPSQLQQTSLHSLRLHNQGERTTYFHRLQYESNLTTPFQENGKKPAILLFHRLLFHVIMLIMHKSWQLPAPWTVLVAEYRLCLWESAISGQSNQPNSKKCSKTSFLAHFCINHADNA